MKWHLGPLVGFDTETTGVNVEHDRVVTATVALLDGTGRSKPESIDVIINPGIDIPAEAANVHGWTTERLAAEPKAMPPAEGLEFVAGVLATALTVEADTPLIGHNVCFDLTILDRDCRRHEVPTLADRLGPRPLYCVDTFVLSKYLNPYRKRVSETQGPHQLKTCAQVWGVGWDDAAAHDAAYDALTSARVAWMIAHRSKLETADLQGIEATVGGARVFPFRDSRDVGRLRRLHGMSLAGLHDLQVRAAAEQAAEYREYLRKQGKPDVDVSGEWPVRAFRAQGALV